MKSTRVVILAVILGGLSCDTMEPPPPPPPQPVPTITLKVKDTGVNEVWLQIAVPDTVIDRSFLLTRDGNVVDTSIVTGPDTVLIDSGLASNRQYTYRAYRLMDYYYADSTDFVQVTTLDTTSHDFTWETFEWGDHSTSVLLDVAIISENDIWAVGEIFLNDSTGNADPDSYNAIHWNGYEWQILRVPFQICGTPAIGSPIIYSMLILSSDYVLFTEGGNLVTWNGQGYGQMCLPSGLALGTLRQIWASSENDLYIVGDRGTIVHYDGTSWQRIESGTSVDINDVWGAQDIVTGDTVIYAAATNGNGFGERILLQIHADGSVSQVSYTPQRFLQTVWFSSPERVFVGGGTVFVGHPGDWTEVAELSTYFSRSIRGTARNNIFVAGDFGLFGHYNGSTWRTYPELLLSNGTYEAVAAKDDFVVAVGIVEGRAIVLRGYRQ